MEIKRNDENKKNEIEQEIKKVLQNDENEERRWNIISYVSLVFSDIFLLNIFLEISFFIFFLSIKLNLLPYFKKQNYLIIKKIIVYLNISLFFWQYKKIMTILKHQLSTKKL